MNPALSRGSKLGVKLAMPTFGEAVHLFAVELTSLVLQKETPLSKNQAKMLAGHQMRPERYSLRAPFTEASRRGPLKFEKTCGWQASLRLSPESQTGNRTKIDGL